MSDYKEAAEEEDVPPAGGGSSGPGADHEASGSTEPLPVGFAIPSIPARYAIRRRIAAGGMAAVYLATDTVLGRDVAVKVLHAPSNADASVTERRFRLEAEALARLNHRNIVHIYDYGTTADNGFYLVMEYVDGATLARWLGESTGEQARPRALRVMVQVAHALRYVHRHGIIHRDLKAANVLVAHDEAGEELVKLVDFGLVKWDRVRDFTQVGIVMGTPQSMAPEQISAGEIDARTDIYSFGVVLYRVAVGRYPFHCKEDLATFMAHLHQEAPSFASVNPDLTIPDGLEEIVMRCLRKNPADRYQSCDELLTDLNRVMVIPEEEYISVTMSAVTPEILPIADRWTFDPRVWVVALVVVVALSAGAMIGMQGQIWLSEDPAPVAAPRASPQAAPTPEVPSVTPPAPEAVPPVEVVAVADPSRPAPARRTAPLPAPVSAPVPAPAPIPQVASPQPAPAVEPAAAPVVAATAAPAIAVPAAPPETTKASVDAATSLLDLDVSVAGDRVTVRGTMSSAAVAPLHYRRQGADPTYPNEYVIQFKGGKSAIGKTVVPVGAGVLSSLTIQESGGKLVIVARSTVPDRLAMDYTASGKQFTLVIHRP